MGSQGLRFDNYQRLGLGQRPLMRTHDDIFEDASKVLDSLRDHPERAVDGKRTNGVVGRSPLFDLPYFDLVHHTPLDMMHVTSGVVGAHLIGMLTGDRLKNAKRSANQHAANQEAAKEKADAAAVAKADKLQSDIDALKTKQGRASTTVMKNKLQQQIDELHGKKRMVLEGAIRVHGPGPEEAAAAAVNHSARELALASMPWNMSEAEAVEIERVAYREIRAPTGVAPHSKRPLSCSSEMTAHHWMNFVKVYGKYLLSLKYTGDCLRVACALLDFVKDCLLSHLPPGKADEINVKARELAKDIHKFFPHTERSMVLHLLIFHIPQGLHYFGPMRTVWAFWAER